MILVFKPDSSGALSSNGDSVWVSSKAGNVLFDPSQSHQLVLEALIASNVITTLQGQKPQGPQPIVDGHYSNPRLQEVVRPSAQISTTYIEASAMDPEEDRLELSAVRRETRSVNTQIEAVKASDHTCPEQ